MCVINSWRARQRREGGDYGKKGCLRQKISLGEVRGGPRDSAVVLRPIRVGEGGRQVAEGDGESAMRCCKAGCDEANRQRAVTYTVPSRAYGKGRGKADWAI